MAGLIADFVIMIKKRIKKLVVDDKDKVNLNNIAYIVMEGFNFTVYIDPPKQPSILLPSDLMSDSVLHKARIAFLEVAC